MPPAARLEGPQSSRFLLLPAELRVEIYKLLLVSNCAYRLGHHGLYCHVNTRKKLSAAILRTNNAIYAEARPVLYGENVFFFGTLYEPNPDNHLKGERLGYVQKVLNDSLGTANSRISWHMMRRAMADIKANCTCAGPLNHKPTYSFTLRNTIGLENASLIKDVLLHCTRLGDLWPTYINDWLRRLHICPENIRFIGISQSIPSDCPVPHIPTHATQMLGSQAIIQTQWQANANLTVTNAGTLETSMENPVLTEEEALANVVKKADGWMEIVPIHVVRRYVTIENSDLRAGQFWLVHFGEGFKRTPVVERSVEERVKGATEGKGKEKDLWID